MHRDHDTAAPSHSKSLPAGLVTVGSANCLSVDLLAELRSEDDGMPEHADKASDPVGWAARRGEPIGTP